LISVREIAVTSTEAKAKLNALLTEVERTGASVTITNHGRPVAALMPAHQHPRHAQELFMPRTHMRVAGPIGRG
jgi:prevent-host-death family protein